MIPINLPAKDKTEKNQPESGQFSLFTSFVFLL